MRIASFHVIFVALAGFAAQPLLAADDEFEGKASFGYLATSGNSESSSVNAAAELIWNDERWKHALNLSALGAQDDVDTTAEAYTLGWQTDWTINDASYLFFSVNAIKDNFSGFERQISESIGYGRKFIDTESTTWSGEIGAGARQSEVRNGESLNETILLAATDYTYRFSETGEFNAGVRAEAGDENTLIESVAAIKARLVGDLALVASYRVRHNTDAPANTEETDTFTAISLEYSF